MQGSNTSQLINITEYMDQELLTQHLKKTLLGRIRLKLLHKISRNNSIPGSELVQRFLEENIQTNLLLGELYAAILLISDFDCKYYKQLKSVSNIKGLLKALEKFPLEEQYFLEFAECPQPLPETLGIIIKSSKLANVDHGLVYSIYLLGEEIFPKGLIDYIEVRACESMPDPIICSHQIEGRSTSDLKKIKDSLTTQIALKSLYFLLTLKIEEEKQRRQGEVVKSSGLIPVSKNLSARFLRQASGRMELAVVIKEETSAEELKSAWPTIDTLRTRLREYQGTNLNQVHHALLYGYYQLRENGWGPTLIAMDINYDCLVNLCQANDEIVDIDAETISSQGFSNAYQLLESVRVKETDILDWLLNGLKEIRNGNSPWPLDSGPVDKQKVLDSIRQWKRMETSQKVIVQKPPETKTVPIDILISPSTKRYQQMAKELLNRTFPGSYEKYHKRATETMLDTGYLGNIHVQR